MYAGVETDKLKLFSLVSFFNNLNVNGLITITEATTLKNKIDSTLNGVFRPATGNIDDLNYLKSSGVEVVVTLPITKFKDMQEEKLTQLTQLTQISKLPPLIKEQPSSAGKREKVKAQKKRVVNPVRFVPQLNVQQPSGGKRKKVKAQKKRVANPVRLVPPVNAQSLKENKKIMDLEDLKTLCKQSTIQQPTVWAGVKYSGTTAAVVQLNISKSQIVARFKGMLITYPIKGVVKGTLKPWMKWFIPGTPETISYTFGGESYTAKLEYDKELSITSTRANGSIPPNIQKTMNNVKGLIKHNKFSKPFVVFTLWGSGVVMSMLGDVIKQFKTINMSMEDLGTIDGIHQLERSADHTFKSMSNTKEIRDKLFGV